MTRTPEWAASVTPDTPVPASTVAALRLRELRLERGLSGRELAALCAGLGATGITAPVVTNIEVGRRTVTVDDLLVLALALDVPPIALLTPSVEQPLTVAVGSAVALADRDRLAGWMCGDEPLPECDEARYTAYVADRMPAPVAGRQSAAAAKEFQSAAARLLGHVDEEIAAFGDRVRGEFSTALDQIGAGIDRGDTPADLAGVIDKARQRLRGPRTGG